MNNYQYALSKIMRADTVEALGRVETLLSQLYDSGFLTVNQLSRLDCVLVDHSIALEEEGLLT